jgi:hypothetical protein
MKNFCNCKDWKNLTESYDLFEWEPPYGWVIKWIKLTEEKGYNQVHRYGIPIVYCPMCGKKLKDYDSL